MRVFIYLLVLVHLFVRAESRYVNVKANLEFTMVEAAPTQFSADLVRKCAQQTELSLQELLVLDSDNGTEATQCFTHCLYEQLGLMHDGIFVDPDPIGHPTELSNPTDDCRLLRGANKCETAHKIHQCKQQMQADKLNVGHPKIEESTTSSRYEI